MAIVASPHSTVCFCFAREDGFAVSMRQKDILQCFYVTHIYGGRPKNRMAANANDGGRISSSQSHIITQKGTGGKANDGPPAGDINTGTCPLITAPVRKAREICGKSISRLIRLIWLRTEKTKHNTCCSEVRCPRQNTSITRADRTSLATVGPRD